MSATYSKDTSDLLSRLGLSTKVVGSKDATLTLATHIIDCLKALEEVTAAAQRISVQQKQHGLPKDDLGLTLAKNLVSVVAKISIAAYSTSWPQERRDDASQYLAVSNHFLGRFPDIGLQVSTSTGRALIHRAMASNTSLLEPRLVDNLITSASTKIKDKKQRLPIHDATRNRLMSWEIVDFLIRENPESVKSPDAMGWLPLHYATMRDSESAIEVVRILLHAWAPAAKCPCKRGRLPLHYAASNPTVGFPVLAMLLQAHPEAAKTPCSQGWLPLHCLVSRGGGKEAVDPRSLRLLIDAFPESLATPNMYGETPLHRCAECLPPDLDTLRYLLEGGGSRKAQSHGDSQGYVPILVCADALDASVEAIEIFLQEPSQRETQCTHVTSGGLSLLHLIIGVHRIPDLSLAKAVAAIAPQMIRKRVTASLTRDGEKEMAMEKKGLSQQGASWDVLEKARQRDMTGLIRDLEKIETDSVVRNDIIQAFSARLREKMKVVKVPNIAEDIEKVRVLLATRHESSYRSGSKPTKPQELQPLRVAPVAKANEDKPNIAATTPGMHAQSSSVKPHGPTILAPIENPNVTLNTSPTAKIPIPAINSTPNPKASVVDKSSKHVAMEDDDIEFDAFSTISKVESPNNVGSALGTKGEFGTLAGGSHKYDIGGSAMQKSSDGTSTSSTSDVAMANKIRMSYSFQQSFSSLPQIQGSNSTSSSSSNPAPLGNYGFSGGNDHNGHSNTYATTNPTPNQNPNNILGSSAYGHNANQNPSNGPYGSYGRGAGAGRGRGPPPSIGRVGGAGALRVSSMNRGGRAPPGRGYQVAGHHGNL